MECLSILRSGGDAANGNPAIIGTLHGRGKGDPTRLPRTLPVYGAVRTCITRERDNRVRRPLNELSKSFFGSPFTNESKPP